MSKPLEGQFFVFRLDNFCRQFFLKSLVGRECLREGVAPRAGLRGTKKAIAQRKKSKLIFKRNLKMFRFVNFEIFVIFSISESCF